MMRWSLAFLVLALVAGVFGFGGISNASADIAKIIFFVALIAWVVSLILGRRSVP